ncbi:MAG: TIR domain-containing protein, partial [Henriciella sp.]
MKSRFDAFISYRHVSDGAFAAEFEVHLKRYAKSPLQSPRRIFRDEQHVRPGEDLSRTIQKALEGASYLILLASPEGAKSQWVRKEMDVWCGELGRADRIIIVLTDGEIALTEDGQSLDWSRTTALPPNLQGHLTNLPLWVDLRGFDESSLRQLGEPRYRAAINAIVARLEDQDPNRLSGVEWKIRRRNQQIAWSAASIMAILLAASIYSAFALFRSNTNLEHALKVSQSREYAATSRLQGMPMAMESAIAAVRAEPTREAVRALLDVMSGNRALRRHIARAHDAVETLAVSEDGQLLFYPDTGAAAPAITVMGADGTSLGRISLTDAGRVWDISMSGPHLYVLSDNGVWIAQADCMCAEKLFDISNDAFLTKLEAMDDRLILGGADGRLFAYSLSDKALLPVDDMQAALSDIASHDGMFAVAATTSDRSVRVWMAGASEPRDVEGIGERAVNAIVFSPDGRYLAGAFEQWSVAVWSVPELTLLWESDLEDNGSAVAFSPDSDLLAAGSNAGDISVFNLEWGDSEDSFTAIRGGVWELAWLDEGLI